MLYCPVNHEDFVQVLAALPEPPAVVRAYLLGAFGVLVSSDDPQAWWDAMWRDRGEEGAAKAVAQLIISKGGKRVFSLIEAHVSGRDPVARADDPKLLRLLFDDSMEAFLTEQMDLRSIVCEYYEDTQLVEEEDIECWTRTISRQMSLLRTRSRITMASTVMDLLTGKPRPSAQRGAEWTLERVQTPARGFLAVPAGFSEARSRDVPLDPLGAYRLRIRPAHLSGGTAAEPESGEQR